MTHSFKIVGVVAVAAIAACTDQTAPTAPALESSALRTSVAAAAGGRVVVTESDITRQPEGTLPTDNWVFYYWLPTSTGVFVSGPGDPPLGVGSFLMSTPAVGDKTTLFNYDHVGTPLADITDITYYTYRQASTNPTDVALPSINIQVDRNGGELLSGDFLTLVYEPYQNNASIQSGVWREWNTIPGMWWATRPITRADGTVCVPQACTLSWSEIVALLPGATIVGGFGVNQGSFNAGLIAATDGLSIRYDGTTWTYDFEPFRSPSTKDDCKKGGWEEMRDAGGAPFKNQGQCIKYANKSAGETE